MIDDADLGVWKPWFAWHPVKCEGKTVWLKKIYRQKFWWHHRPGMKYFKYRTLFGMLKK